MSGTWRTKEGREIPFAELEDGHLLNVLGLLRRRAILAIASRNVTLLRQGWPDDADCDGGLTRMFSETWREHVGPEFEPLHALAVARMLDVSSFLDDGYDEQKAVELALLESVGATFLDKSLDDFDGPIPEEVHRFIEFSLISGTASMTRDRTRGP